MNSPTSNWNEQEIELFKSLYGTLELEEIQKKYFPQFTLSQIKYAPRRFKLIIPGKRQCPRQQKYTYNSNFFDDINIINSYWGGYLAADGCIRHTQFNSWILGFCTIDEYLANQFINDIEYTGSYYTEQRSNKTNYIIQIRGIQHDWLTNLTKNFKIIPNKTKFLEPPDLKNKEDILAYIKGYIDGDGSITLKRSKWLNLHICSYTNHILEWILEHIKKEVNTKINITKRKNRQLYQIDLGSHPAYNFLKILCNIPRGLPRKWNKIREYEILYPEILSLNSKK